MQANASGVLSGSFTIPAGIPAGAKNVVFTGAGGSKGQATFIGQGTTQIDTRQLVTTVTTWRYDPLAETFMLDAAQQIAGIDLWFTAKGSTPVEVQIRETIGGVPSQTILASVRKQPVDIVLGGAPTVCDFPRPISLAGGTEYAIVVMCNDAITACSIAALGQWDAAAGKWVTAQPYQVGVLLSSSNASSWTPHQDRDLTFRLRKAVFTQTTRTIALGSVAVTNVSDMVVRANVENPSGVTRCDFQLTLPDGTVMLVAAEQPIHLAANITGTVLLSAILTGTATESPTLLGDVQLVTGTVSSTATYISRAITGGTGVRVKVIYEATLPSGSSVVVAYQSSDVLGTWTTVPQTASLMMGNGNIEMTHELAGITATAINIRLSLTGTTAARPIITNLRFMTV